EHEERRVVARQEAQPAEEPLGGVPIAALALHGLDDRAEELAGRERLVHGRERRDLGGEQRVLLGVAEPLAELVEGAGGARGVEPARRGGLLAGRAPHGERREPRLVALELERRALA